MLEHHLLGRSDPSKAVLVPETLEYQLSQLGHFQSLEKWFCSP